MRLALVVALAAAAAATPLTAQMSASQLLLRDSMESAIRAEQEVSYVTFPTAYFGLPRQRSQGEDLRVFYEARISPAFFIHVGHWPVFAAVTPKVVLRQYQHGSYPVPPPSFMPRITFYAWSQSAARSTLEYYWLRISHHSNGQDGPIVDSTTLGLNYRDGSWSTNFVELGLSRRFSNWRVFGFLDGEQRLSIEWHPEGPGGSDLARQYGNTRLNFATGLQYPGKDVRYVQGVDLAVTYVRGNTPPAIRRERRLAVGLTTYAVIPGTDFSWFFGGYIGQDYYNVRQDRYISVARLGVLASDLTSALRGHASRPSIRPRLQ